MQHLLGVKGINPFYTSSGNDQNCSFMACPQAYLVFKKLCHYILIVFTQLIIFYWTWTICNYSQICYKFLMFTNVFSLSTEAASITSWDLVACYFWAPNASTHSFLPKLFPILHFFCSTRIFWVISTGLSALWGTYYPNLN